MPFLLALPLMLVLGTCLLTVTTSFMFERARSLSAVVLLLFTLGMAVMAYYVQPVPGSYTDLERIATEVHLVEEHGVSQIADLYALNPLSTVLIAIAAGFHDVNLLKAISAFLLYGALFLVIYCEWAKKHISRGIFLFMFVFVMIIVNMPGVVFGVRQGASFAMAIAGAYLWLRNRQPIAGCVIIVAATLLHFSSVVVLAAVLLSRITRTGILRVIYFCIALYPLLTYVPVWVLAKIGAGSAVQILLSKMNGYYMFGSNFELFASPLAQATAALRLCMCIGIVLLARYYARFNVQQTAQRYCRFFIIIMLVCVGSALTGTPFRRFTSLAWYVALPLVAWVMQGLIERNQVNQRIGLQSQSNSSSFSVRVSNLYDQFIYSRVLYMIFICILFALVVMSVYDWHSFTRFYISAQQVYA